jgi:surfactin synthase thioesterase subunit
MAGRWLLRRPPAGDGPLLLAFPYAGGGASLYRAWPTHVGDAWFGALGPPGREFRSGEPPARTFAEFTGALVPYLEQLGDRPLIFFGHCGGVPLALSTSLAMVDAGLRPPARIVASAWGPPHRGLYGPLNHVDLAAVDLTAEVERMFVAAGVPVRKDIVEIAASTLRVDLEMHRPHRYDASRQVPAPVTVIGWSADEVVPPRTAMGREWRDCANVEFHALEGAHFDFTRCPASLRDLIAAATRVGVRPAGT